MPRKTKPLTHFLAGEQVGFNEAAARCRGKPDHLDVRAAVAPASMRPRPDAAENPARPCPTPAGARRFNEAAARCRGKRREIRARRAASAAASMRPRPDAAENSRCPVRQVRVHAASMRPRPDAAENEDVSVTGGAEIELQ